MNPLVKTYLAKLEKAYPIREAENILYILFEDAHGISRTSLLLESENEWDKRLVESQLERLINNEPVQHITGIAHFYGYVYQVSKDVLIPRPETEELVDWMISDNEITAPSIWDIGTGSGCIAISLSRGLKQSKVLGIDLSEEALDLAKTNIEKGATNVAFQKLDILKDIPSGKPNIIVSNPPYIPDSDRANMHSNILDHEPGMALFVSDHDPLIFYRRIAEIGKEKLASGGWLYFEINEKMGAETVQLLTNLGYHEITLRKDMQEKDRMIRAKKDA